MADGCSASDDELDAGEGVYAVGSLVEATMMVTILRVEQGSTGAVVARNTKAKKQTPHQHLSLTAARPNRSQRAGQVKR